DLQVSERHEEGFAVRFLRGHNSWHAGVDGFAPGAIDEAIRLAARVHPRTPRPLPAFVPPPAPRRDPEVLLAAVANLGRALGPKAEIVLRRHERISRVIGPQIAGPEQRERFLSLGVRVGKLGWSTLLAP